MNHFYKLGQLAALKLANFGSQQEMQAFFNTYRNASPQQLRKAIDLHAAQHPQSIMNPEVMHQPDNGVEMLAGPGSHSQPINQVPQATQAARPRAMAARPDNTQISPLHQFQQDLVGVNPYAKEKWHATESPTRVIPQSELPKPFGPPRVPEHALSGLHPMPAAPVVGEAERAGAGLLGRLGGLFKRFRA